MTRWFATYPLVPKLRHEGRYKRDAPSWARSYAVADVRGAGEGASVGA